MSGDTVRKRRSTSTTQTVAPPAAKKKKKASAKPKAAAAQNDATCGTDKAATDSDGNKSSVDHSSTEEFDGDESVSVQNNCDGASNPSSPGADSNPSPSPPQQVMTRPETARTVTPPAALMKAVLDLNPDSPDYKSLLKNQVKTTVWSLCKFPNYDSPMGEMVKKFIQAKLGMKDLDFNNHWARKGGIRSDVNDILRHHRAYVLQQMKVEYFSEW